VTAHWESYHPCYANAALYCACCPQVTWVVHAEYDEAVVHPLYRPLLQSGQALGARRWLASLQRQCQYLAILCSNSLPARDHAGE
jgi:homeobox-leucine zipper protein